jgi:hypothetical protein
VLVRPADAAGTCLRGSTCPRLRVRAAWPSTPADTNTHLLLTSYPHGMHLMWTTVNPHGLDKRTCRAHRWASRFHNTHTIAHTVAVNRDVTYERLFDNSGTSRIGSEVRIDTGRRQP